MKCISFLTIAFLSVALISRFAMSGDVSAGSVDAQIQGRWEIVAGVNQGRELTPAEVKGTYVAIKDNQIMTFDSQENQRYKAVFVIDDSTSPVQVKMTSFAQDVVDRLATAKKEATQSVAFGIMKIDNPKKWTLCYALPGAERPTSFKSSVGSKVMLFNLEKK